MALLRQSDGKLIVVGGGARSQNTLDVTRINADGSPDTSYRHYMSWTGFFPMDAGLDKTDRLVVTGVNATTGTTAVLLRLSPQGELDRSFGSGGMATHAGAQGLWGVGLHPDGTISTSGGFRDPAFDGFPPLVGRFRADGTANSPSGPEGVHTLGVGTSAQATPEA